MIPQATGVLKWEIAGVIPVDSRSFGQTLKDSYAHAGITGTAKNKLANAYTIIYAPDAMNHLYSDGPLGVLRDMEFRFIFFGLGILNIGWLVYLLPRGKAYLKATRIAMDDIKLSLGIVAAGIVAWRLIMFGPGSTIIHGGSYLTMIILFVCLGSVLTTLPRRALQLLTVVKVMYFAIIWVITIYAHSYISKPYVFLSLASTLALGLCLTYVTKHANTLVSKS